ncbi:putative integral membrane protein [Botryosphaeria dothidea]|uniref:Integral membrane protein n=1 Tax=Botryosphaeria dothidea TaxID=55169 RepID=A0A8H4ITP3_9PEZI|nr:putative integral membrane protein [Botryosphaeria dothidea]
MESTTEKPEVYGIYGSGRGLFGFNTASMIVLWIMFALRAYVRLVMVKVWSAADWHMAITMVLYTWLCISINISIWDGFGRDMETLPPKQLATAFKQYYFGEFTYVSSVLFVKLSLAYFYLPLTNLRWQIYTVQAIIWINTLYTIGYVCVIIFQCSPVPHFWTQFVGTKGVCLNNTVIMNLSYTHNSMEIISDWIISALPIWLLKETQLARRTKAAVALLLSLGAFASIASIIRITQLTSFASSTNYTITSIPIIEWSIIENAVGIFAANLATLRLLLSLVLERLGFSTASGSASGPSHAARTGTSRHRPRHSAAAKSNGYIFSGEGHDLPSLKRENSNAGSFKSTERIVGGQHVASVTTTVSKGPRAAYDDDDNSSAEELGALPSRGISKNTQVTVTTEYRK